MDMGALFRRFVAGRRARCPVCRYDLTDAPEPRCPECGEALELYAFHDTVAHVVRVLIAAVLLAPLTLSIPVLLLEYTDPISRRRPSPVVHWLLGVGIGSAAAAAVVARWMRVLQRRRARRERDSSRDVECEVLEELTVTGMRCPVRGSAVVVGSRACPACGDRVTVRVRPVRPVNLWDRRAGWLLGTLAVLALAGGAQLAGIGIALWLWHSRFRPAQAAGLAEIAPPWASGAFWFAVGGVLFNVSAMVAVWLRRRRLIPAERRERLLWQAGPLAVSGVQWLILANLMHE